MHTLSQGRLHPPPVQTGSTQPDSAMRISGVLMDELPLASTEGDVDSVPAAEPLTRMP